MLDPGEVGRLDGGGTGVEQMLGPSHLLVPIAGISSIPLSLTLPPIPQLPGDLAVFLELSIALVARSPPVLVSRHPVGGGWTGGQLPLLGEFMLWKRLRAGGGSGGGSGVYRGGTGGRVEETIGLVLLLSPPFVAGKGFRDGVGVIEEGGDEGDGVLQPV